MKKIRKQRPFQLLELMIAAFILFVCIAPVVRIFTALYHESHQLTKESMRDHIARLIHAGITEKLYRREIPLEALQAGAHITLADEEIAEQLKKYGYTSEGSIKLIRYRSEGGQPIMRLAEICIKIKDVSPQKRKNKDEKENEEPWEVKTKLFISLTSTDKNSYGLAPANLELTEEALQEASEKVDAEQEAGSMAVKKRKKK